MVTRLEKIGDELGSGGVATPPAAPEPPVRLPRYRSGYSRFVRLTKYALPVIAGVVIVLLVAWPELKPKPAGFRLGISDLKVATAGGQQIVKARFTGVDSQNRPFSVTAASAVQPPDDKHRVFLDKPKADITLENQSWVAVTSPKGIYWLDKKVLALSGGVDLFQDEGYEVTTQTATVDLRQGYAWGDSAVHGQGPFGTVDADGFRIYNRGQRVMFTGKAHMVLYPSQAPSTARSRASGK